MDPEDQLEAGLDLNSEDPLEQEEQEQEQQDTKPDPQAEAEQRFQQMLETTINSALDARGVNKAAEKATEKQEEFHPGFTPEEIVQSTVTVSRALRQAEREIRAEYGNVLDDGDIEQIMQTLESQPVGQLVNLIRQKSHFGAADMMLGRKVKTGQLKPGNTKQVKNSPTPIGNNAPREGTGKGSTLKKFESLYGNPKTKGQQARLRDGV